MNDPSSPPDEPSVAINPSRLAKEAVQRLADSEPSGEVMEAQELLRGTVGESLYLAEGEVLEQIFEATISDFLYDEAASRSPAPPRQYHPDDFSRFDATYTRSDLEAVAREALEKYRKLGTTDTDVADAAAEVVTRYAPQPPVATPPTEVDCKVCGGTGEGIIDLYCHTCGASGKVPAPTPPPPTATPKETR